MGDVTHGRYTGIEVYGRFKELLIRARERYYFVDGIVIALQVSTSDTTYDLDGPEPNRFFDSLKILK